MFIVAGLTVVASHALAYWLGRRSGVRQCRRMAGAIVGMMLADPKIHIQR